MERGASRRDPRRWMKPILRSDPASPTIRRPRAESHGERPEWALPHRSRFTADVEEGPGPRRGRGRRPAGDRGRARRASASVVVERRVIRENRYQGSAKRTRHLSGRSARAMSLDRRSAKSLHAGDVAQAVRPQPLHSRSSIFSSTRGLKINHRAHAVSGGVAIANLPSFKSLQVRAALAALIDSFRSTRTVARNVRGRPPNLLAQRPHRLKFCAAVGDPQTSGSTFDFALSAIAFEDSDAADRPAGRLTAGPRRVKRSPACERSRGFDRADERTIPAPSPARHASFTSVLDKLKPMIGPVTPSLRRCPRAVRSFD